MAVVVALSVLAALFALGATPAGAALPAGSSTLTGTLRYADGQPVDGAFVTACAPAAPVPPGGYGCLFGGSTDGTQTDANGRFTFAGIAPGTYQLTTGPPASSLDPWAVLTLSSTFTVGTGTTTQDLTLAQGGTVTGRALAADGSPLAGTQVSIRPNGELIGLSATTDAAGVYTSSRAMAGTSATVSFAFPVSGGFPTSASVALVPTQLATAPDLRVDPGGTVTGKVTGPAGPVAGATVTVTNANCAGLCTPATTNSTGDYSLLAPSGAGGLSVNPGTTTLLPVSNLPVTVLTGQSVTRDVTLQAAPTSAQVSMQVRTDTGTPGIVTVAIVCASPNTPTPVYTGLPDTECTTPGGVRTADLGTYTPAFGAEPRSTTTSGVPAPQRVNVAAVDVPALVTNAPVRIGPVATLDVAANDTVSCTTTIDVSGTAGGGTISCSGATGTPPGGSNTVTLPPATGGGSATITSPAGTTLSAVGAVDTSGATLPPGASLPYGAFAFTVTGVPADPGWVDVTISYPLAAPAPNGYVKYVGGSWVDASSIVQSQGPGTVTIRLVDGGPWDPDGVKDGTIVDPGGPAVLDRTAPTVAVTGVADGGSYTLGAVPTPGCSASDTGGSGLGTPACSVAVSGGTGLGVGSFTATATATDRAGNTATATATYTVRFATRGFDAPIDNLPLVNSGRAGRAYPVKWGLTDASGRAVTDLSAVTSLRYRSLSCSATASSTEAPLEVEATGGTALRIVDGRFQFNWATPSTAGCYELVVALADGSSLTAQFHLR